jgi:archaellum component FlaC
MGGTAKKKGRKRNKSQLSPSTEGGEPKSKMAQPGSQGIVTPDQSSQPNSSQYNLNTGTQSYIAPATLQFQNQNHGQHQYYGSYQNPGSPLFVQQQQQPYMQNVQTCQTTSSPKQNDELLLTILKRIESVEKKLGQLDQISTQVTDINTRIGNMDQRISEIDKSQKFLCDKFDEITIATSSNKENIKQLQEKVEKLSRQNTKLKADSNTIADDIIDLKCRSMRDNLLFFGIAEGPVQAPVE